MEVNSGDVATHLFRAATLTLARVLEAQVRRALADLSVDLVVRHRSRYRGGVGLAHGRERATWWS